MTITNNMYLSPVNCISAGRENFSEKVMQAASKGFIGCLSSVQFNHVAPLKAALTNRGSSLVTIRGPLVQSNCGALAESTSHTLQGKTFSHFQVELHAEEQLEYNLKTEQNLGLGGVVKPAKNACEMRSVPIIHMQSFIQQRCHAALINCSFSSGLCLLFLGSYIWLFMTTFSPLFCASLVCSETPLTASRSLTSVVHF